MLENGKDVCSCKKTSCERHGKCKECIENHINGKLLPYCKREKSGLTKKWSKYAMLLIPIILCILAIPLVFMLVKQNAKPAYVATVDGEPITEREVDFRLENGRSDIIHYFQNKYDVKTIDPEFWTRSFNGEIPLEYGRKRFYDESVRIKIQQILAKWIESKDTAEVERIQDVILGSYELDFAKHAPATDFPKLSLIWKSIPDQLAKENGKFVYGHVKPGARAKDFEDALQWLISSGMVYKVCKIEKPAIPLSAYSDQNYFKLYMSDIGLLRRMSRLPAASIFEEPIHYAEFKGALTENYVLSELINLHGDVPYYWKSGNTAEVDFIGQFEEKIVPIEVKASVNVKARSLGVYREKYMPEVSVRTSMLNLKMDDGLLNIPLYMLWTVEKLIKGEYQK